MAKALARTFRWRKMLDGGVCATIEELAKREKVNRGYMSRVMRLTLLAPEIVEAILDGRQPEGWRLCWRGSRWVGRGGGGHWAVEVQERADSRRKVFPDLHCEPVQRRP